ncbi:MULTISPECIES: hypothetical protein [unclassified Acidocella]|uniref:hypothetical protein n=1 Tax=unclassified Acidocella TaxID=2648610 RepID=UPI00028EDC87|nr:MULTISPECIES: hypothetical protein [unclassified Acidocella]EKM98139.1 hypothetical protein MXAZACID_17034 [Acidocella sp. MX-AZ02]WBO59002.1 hypothetical protein GT370_18260 [Acidocella sp. MX-AZ03]
MEYKSHMGVQLYILDRRPASLVIAGTRHQIGTLRRSWKLTEIDAERAAEISAAEENLKDSAAPAAAMVADVVDMHPLEAPDRPVAAHVVIGWEANRHTVTDMAWDFLPVLGFAVRAPSSDGFVLHEERDGGLAQMTLARAVELSILDKEGRLQRHGQPAIAKCLGVRPFIQAHAIAECELVDGRSTELVTELRSDNLPSPSWYVGKLPSQTKIFP